MISNSDSTTLAIANAVGVGPLAGAMGTSFLLSFCSNCAGALAGATRL